MSTVCGADAGRSKSWWYHVILRRIKVVSSVGKELTGTIAGGISPDRIYSAGRCRRICAIVAGAATRHGNFFDRGKEVHRGSGGGAIGKSSALRGCSVSI